MPQSVFSNVFYSSQVLSKLKDPTTRAHFGDDVNTLVNPAVVRNNIETLKDQVNVPSIKENVCLSSICHTYLSFGVPMNEFDSPRLAFCVSMNVLANCVCIFHTYSLCT